MSYELIELFSGYVRAYMISISGQSVGVAVCNLLMKRRKNIKPLLVFLVVKTGMAMYLNAFLNYYFTGQDWAVITNALFTTFIALATWLMFAYTFDGGLLKCNLGMNMSELIAGTIMLPSAMIVNMLEQRADLFSFYGEFQAADLLICVVEGIFCVVFCRLAASLLKKFRALKVRYERVWWCIILVYTISMQAVALIDLRDSRMFMITMYILYLGCAAIGVTGMVMIYRRYMNGIQKRNAFLNKQLSLMSAHYASVQEKMMQMEECQRIIDTQMEEITKRDNLSDFQGKTSEYLKNIRNEYDKIRNGLYCNDWLVDAVLYCQIEAANKCGIGTECTAVGYDRGALEEETLAQILFLLFDFGIRENQNLENGSGKKIAVKLQVVMNRLVIEFVSKAEKKRKYAIGELREFVQVNDGDLTLDKMEDGVRILVKLNAAKQPAFRKK